MLCSGVLRLSNNSQRSLNSLLTRRRLFSLSTLRMRLIGLLSVINCFTFLSVFKQTEVKWTFHCFDFIHSQFFPQDSHHIDLQVFLVLFKAILRESVCFLPFHTPHRPSRGRKGEKERKRERRKEREGKQASKRRKERAHACERERARSGSSVREAWLWPALCCLPRERGRSLFQKQIALQRQSCAPSCKQRHRPWGGFKGKRDYRNMKAECMEPLIKAIENCLLNYSRPLDCLH